MIASFLTEDIWVGMDRGDFLHSGLTYNRWWSKRFNIRLIHYGETYEQNESCIMAFRGSYYWTKLKDGLRKKMPEKSPKSVFAGGSCGVGGNAMHIL